ncbi:MAG: helix-turn-helix transcriptional regulator [Burkholderiales bacterium]
MTQPLQRAKTAQRGSRVEAPIGDLDAFTPDAARPVRLRARSFAADSHFEPHRHPWAQLAYCASGVVQVTAARHAEAPDEEVAFIVPPSRAVWIAPGALHQVHVVEAAHLRTLYINAASAPHGFAGSCRVIVVSALLRALIGALDEGASGLRETMLAALVLDEIARADVQPIGVPLPDARTGDKRLRALCEAVLHAPAKRATLAAWAADVGASERTMGRLFREQLGLSYPRWRQQAVLAHALPLLTRGVPVGQVAARSGYASDSAFTAMFRAAMGQSPRHFMPPSRRDGR